ncbi:hypothetical protein [Flavobacterium quisquiliarum]|uniref:DKNYY family protein n=1 Tax=Flavobacterium quisquiliarum TaxID=1834436 RepID=A0ABV8W5J4_9FLAO|nr:hypothetical protein [Flavobacterium quisquiliarum]MBW1657196.1 hypothetical protein [Flavobacterium quisquiliarum]NWL00481.1 hypothetical protein [Flavobacterium collinsii]
MKNPKKKLVEILFFAIFFNIYNIYSQSSNKTLAFNWFDNTVKKENLPINNGKFHTNFDKLLGTVDRYYISDKFSHANLGYENQEYFDVNLKYDIYKDELILKSEGEGLFEINLIKENVQYFKVYDRKFVNLNLDKQFPLNFRSGYYEENLIGENFIFYIKHYKDKKEIIKGTETFIDYYYKNQFVLFINGKYNLINSKSELIKIFPNEKSKINDFYLMNRNLKSENESKFMENLMRYINSI